jgi:DNA-binding response OmpR family regulator
VARILIVEDEAHLAEGLAFNLEQEGHEVEIVGDGRQAVERLARSDPPLQLIVLDLMLPEVGGLEVARRVRASGNYVPILILTAKDAPEDLVPSGWTSCWYGCGVSCAVSVGVARRRSPSSRFASGR